jgi:hypothetical protein
MEIIIKIILYIYIMPPKYKTCSTIWSRQTLDDGSGKIFVPSSFGGSSGDDNCGQGGSNDCCGDVDVNDCPTGYKLLHPHHTPKKGYINDTVTHSGNDLKHHKCWEGGKYGSVGSQSVLGLTHGTTWASNSLDRGFADNDNFGRPCFKDNTGWSRTNPETGNKTTPSESDNKNACCGFKDSVRGSVQEKWCHQNYCFKKNSNDYSIANPDEITKPCADHLLEQCKKWSFVNDLIGFEDDRCADPIGQIAKDFNKHRDNLSDFALAKEVNYSASIQRSEYSKIGDDLCKTDDFLNAGSTDDVKKKKNEKCVQWCQDNSDVCAEKMIDVCQAVYDRVKRFPDVFPDDLKKYEGLCACNWPQEFYDNIIEYYKKTYNVPDFPLGTRRKCLFRPCGSSNIKHVDPYAADSICPQTNFTSCIQNLNIDFSGSQIEGEVNVDAGQSQSCGTLADAGIVADSGGSGEGSSPGGSSPKEEDDTFFIIILVVITLLIISLIAGGVIILI